ncbi:MAG: putative beta-lysine N-acetyltransferase [Candidatus Kapaibacterium sp.]
MYDEIIRIGDSKIHIGEANDRVYLMKLGPIEYPEIISTIEKMAREKNLGKIFAKVGEWASREFLENGYEEEANIPDFFKGTVPAVFFAKYLKPERREIPPNEKKVMDNILKICSTKTKAHPLPVPEEYDIRPLEPKNTPAMAELFKNVFPTYPFPIHEPDYLVEAMDSDVAFYGVFSNGVLLAASSAEMDPDSKNAEMTDFATLPEARGRKLAGYLLQRMEEDTRENYNIITAYTIARALSAGMNITFANAGYTYTGTLKNNTNISGKIESMNVWFKNLIVEL